jgi:hypothetical protein
MAAVGRPKKREPKTQTEKAEVGAHEMLKKAKRMTRESRHSLKLLQGVLIDLETNLAVLIKGELRNDNSREGVKHAA